jgi:hypothetical protein
MSFGFTGFKELRKFLDPKMELPCRLTITNNLIPSEYRKQKEKVKAELEKPKFVALTILTSDPPIKEAVLGVFDLAEIVAGGSKNKRIDGFCAKFFAKLIAKNRNRLAFVVWILNRF